MLESIGLEFEQLWLLGLHDGVWPTQAAPNPFIPLRLQCRLGMPRAEARGELDFCRGVTRSWQGSARSVTASFPARLGDQATQPSPLIAAWPQRAGLDRELSRVAVWRDLIRDRAPALECRADARGPGIDDSGAVVGGARVLQDQAACPFRGFVLLSASTSSAISPAGSLG